MSTFGLLMILTLLSASAPENAQSQAPADPYPGITPASSLSCIKLLFASTEKHYAVDPDVQGVIYIFPSSGTFKGLLNILVDNAMPPLNYDVQDGVYHIHLRHVVPWETGTPITAVNTKLDGKAPSEDETNQQVRQLASPHTTHMAVDTPYDDRFELVQCVRAIRRTGRHVWFRSTFNAWQGAEGTPATMTPAQYTAALKKFIGGNKFLFKPGDILDPLPEPEKGPYWARTSALGKGWAGSGAPNATTDEFNRFFVGVTQAADDALAAAGITGVVTTIRATNADVARPSSTPPRSPAWAASPWMRLREQEQPSRRRTPWPTCRRTSRPS